MKKYSAKVSEKYYLSENKRFMYIKFELTEPNCLNFIAGQYVSLGVADNGTRRSYSIASTPDESHGLHLLVEIIKDGLGSKYVENIKLGATVDLIAPLGKFVVNNPDQQIKRLFVATGSGIVPIWSMINDLLINKKVGSPIRLHWGMRRIDDLFWMDNLERLAAIYPNFVYDVVLSEPNEAWDLCVGHVQNCLERDFEKDDLSDWEGYVCGSPNMVLDVSKKLILLGMNEQKIFHEKFA